MRRVKKFHQPVHSCALVVFLLGVLAGCNSAQQLVNDPLVRDAGAASLEQTSTVFDPAEIARLQARAGRVEITRDNYGVPHIKAKTDADAVFGLLYAQAEDDFKRIERNYIWAIGRLAEVKGESALYSDLRARLYMTQGQARAAYALSLIHI